MRYYALCLMTPDTQSFRSRRRSYSPSGVTPEGFLFHDTESPIAVNDIRKALHTLSDTCESEDSDGALRVNHAYVIRVDAQTLAASFSLAGVPSPQAKTVWLSGGMQQIDANSSKQRGWFLENISDLTKEPAEWHYEDIFDSCTRLERLSGSCPCPLSESGECRETLLRPALPESMRNDSIFRSRFRLEAENFRKVRYKTLPGDWNRTSGKATTTDDFAPTFRPWADYNFDKVDDRKTTLKARGVSRHVREKFRANKCCLCEFSTHHGATVQDCGAVSSCVEPVSVSEVEGATTAWLEHSGFMRMQGFTDKQRDYLIGAAGTQYRSSALGGSRRIHVKLGGFRYSNSRDGWGYTITAAKGDLGRSKQFVSYAEVRAAIPDLPEPDAAAITASRPFNPKIYYALACFGKRRGWHYAFHGHLSIKTIEVRGDYVHWDVTTARWSKDSGSFNIAASSKELIRINPELSYTDVLNYYRQALAAEQIRVVRLLPVVRST